MSIQVDTAPLKKAYEELDTKVKDLNKQVTIYDVKTAAKTTLVYMAIFAAGLLVGVASSMFLGVTFPAAISWQVLTGAAIGFGAAMVFLQTFGEKMFDKMFDKQTELRNKINTDFKKAVVANRVDITQAIFKDAIYSKIFGRFRIDTQFDLNLFGFGIKKVKLDSYETVEKRYIQQENNRRQEEENIKRKEEQNSGFSRFITGFFKRSLSLG